MVNWQMVEVVGGTVLVVGSPAASLLWATYRRTRENEQNVERLERKVDALLAAFGIDPEEDGPTYDLDADDVLAPDGGRREDS